MLLVVYKTLSIYKGALDTKEKYRDIIKGYENGIYLFNKYLKISLVIGSAVSEPQPAFSAIVSTAYFGARAERRCGTVGAWVAGSSPAMTERGAAPITRIPHLLNSPDPHRFALLIHPAPA